MKRLPHTILVVITTVVVALLYTYPVKAYSDQPIQFLDSGTTIYSPVNMTYNGNNLVLNLTLYGAGYLGGLDPQISMNYSIDRLYNGSVPMRSNGEIHVVTTAIATVGLPKLTEGSHTLTIYLYGLNQRTYEPKYLSYTDTVYFSTTGNPPVPTVQPSPTPTSTAVTTPTVPEFPLLAILPLFLFAVSVTLLHKLRKHNRSFIRE